MDSRGKGLWSEVIRRSEAQSSVQSMEGDIKQKLTISGNDYAAESGSKDAGNSLRAPEPEAGAKPLSCSVEREGSPEKGTADSASEASPKLVRSPWKKPTKLPKDPLEGAVMGAESWPSLADSHTAKHSTSLTSAVTQDSSGSNSSQELENFTTFDRQIADHTDDRLILGQSETEARSQASDAATATILLPDPPKVVSELQRTLNPSSHESPHVARPGNPSPGNNAGRGRAPNQRGNNINFFDNAWIPQRNRASGFSGRSGTPHQQRPNGGTFLNPGRPYNHNGANGFYPRPVRAPRQRGNNNAASRTNAANQRMYRDQGRGANNWHSQQFLNQIPPFQQPFFDPRSLIWGVPTFFHPSMGFFNQPVPKDMFYPPMGTPGFPQGAGFYAHSGGLHVLPPVFQNTSVEYFLTKQVEYYFSNENLVKDAFLRSKMDAEGFVPASLIASFNKIKMFNVDTNMILKSLHNSTIVEVQGENLRKRNDWPLWLLPPGQHSVSLNMDSGSSSAEASDNHSICSSRNNELTGIDGGSFNDVDSNIDPEPCLQKSVSSFLDTAGSLMESLPPGIAEPKASQSVKVKTWSSFHPNEDAIGTNE